MAENKQKLIFKGGYLKVFDFVNTIFNLFFAPILLIPSIPILFTIAICIKLQDGGPIFYKGLRLGLNKKLFMMYKIRTLIPDAESLIGAEVLTAKHKLVTPLGKLLRDSRLDELPQLFNILKGNMDFVGPRPQRMAIYEKIGKHIKGYDKRFTIKPGLIGFPQLFLPHSAPKKIQSLVDNLHLNIKQKLLCDIFIIFYTALITIKTISKGVLKSLWNSIKSKILHRYEEKRVLERITQKRAKVYIGTKINDKEIFTDEATLVDINEEAFLIYSNHKIKEDNLIFRMEINHRIKRRMRNNQRRYRRKLARCYGVVYRESEMEDKGFKYSYVIKYTPISPLNYYMVHQYFLLESMVL